MTHDEENERNEAWLRRLLDGLAASNSSAEEVAQRLYAFAHGGRKALLPFVDPVREVSREATGAPTVHIEVFAEELKVARSLLLDFRP